MPKVLEQKGFKFSFYSNENKEKAHLHVSKGNGNAKYWLEPEVKEDYSYGFTLSERREIRVIMQKDYLVLLNKWYGYFNIEK